MDLLPNNWDDQQKDLDASILQSSVWAKFQSELNRKPYFATSSNWSWVGFSRASKGIKYLFLPYGPTIASDADGCLQSIMQVAKDANFDFVRIEPIGKVSAEDIKKAGGVRIAELDPMHTQLIDLTKPIDELRSEMRSGHRNPINTAEKRQVSVYSSTGKDELPDFLRFMDDTAQRAGIKNYGEDYYKKLVDALMPVEFAKFYVAKAGEQKASISIVYDYNGTRSYAWAGNDQMLNRQSQASVVNVWQMIVDAKEAGMKTFDLWGVAPVDAPAKHKWAGISSFKRGFGGETTETIGTWDIPLKKSKYKAYKMYRKLRGMDE
jgi:lipid II:glycine glycyltransferase (peptidoglycan interpeptide bridge formation enzyme)